VSGLDTFERFCSRLVLDSGEPFVLADFQRFLLEPFFAGASTCAILTPKGAGKSTLLGAIALYALLGTAESDIVIAASSRDQAAVLLGQAAGFVRRSPALARRLKLTRREIHFPSRAGRLRVISADASTGDGLIPYPVALCDELHRWAGDDLFSTLSTSLSKRGARMLVISTAGERETPTPLWRIREKALTMNARRQGVRLSCDSEDGSFALRELSAPEDADWRDLDMAEQVNPLVSRETLAERFASPAQTERSWRRFTLNMWTDPVAAEEVISPDQWAALADASLPQPDGVLCFGVDVSLERDVASIAVAGWVGEKVLVETVESGLGVAWVAERLVKLTEARSCLPVIIDAIGPSGALVARVQEWDVDVRETNAREFARAHGTFLDLIREDRLRHRNDPPLTHAVQGAATRSLSDSRAWSRKASLSDVSPLIAATLAAWGLTSLGPVKEGPFGTLTVQG